MADITTFYGYKRQFTFYIENSGANPINVVSAELVNADVFLPNQIFTEIENTFPITVMGNSQLDIITNQYSLYLNDLTQDATYAVTYNIIDMSDYTTVIDTTTVSILFTLINGSVADSTNSSLLAVLNKHFCLGPNGTDATFTANSFSSTGYPLIQFTDNLRYAFFSSRYSPQFVMFNNSGTGIKIIGGNFYFNNDTKTIECYFTEEEKTSLLGLVFNNVILCFTEA